jgi:hypothetical protein
MRMEGGRGAVAAVLVLAGFCVPAMAQVVRAPDEIRACLCKEQALQSLNADVQAQSRTYQEKRQSFEALDRQVQSSRPKVNVNDPAAVDAFKHLLDQRDQASDSLAGPVTRNYSAAVQRYNQAVADYNASCAGKAFDQDQLAQLKRTLSCPKP